MEALTKEPLAITGIWDDDHVKALLHFPRSPTRLIQQEPWQSWIGRHGGLKAVKEYLLHYPFPPSRRRFLEVVFSNPESVADVYAERLNISRSTYFYQLRELIAAVAQALNHWDLEVAEADVVSPLPAELPVPLTEMVGVETTLQTLNRLLLHGGVRLLTLRGPGGVGKTRLSIELCHCLECDARFIDLSHLHDPARFAAVISNELGLEDGDISSLKTAFRDREFVLVLDNFEQILPARTHVTDLLSASQRLKIVITSRIALNVYGEYEFIVHPLAIPDIESVKNQQLWAQSPAVSLFVQRAKAVNPNFALNNENVEAIAELCQRMEGLPLAIELVAFQMKYFSPQAMLARLSEGYLDFLGQVPDRLLPHRRSICTTFDWSFDLLSEDTQNLFCRLSIFPEGFTIEAAEAVCGVEDVQRGLTTLVDHSLLEQSSTADSEAVFKMSALTREYGLRRLVSIGEFDTFQAAWRVWREDAAAQSEKEAKKSA